MCLNVANRVDVQFRFACSAVSELKSGKLSVLCLKSGERGFVEVS